MQVTDIIPPPAQFEFLIILMNVSLIFCFIGAIINWLHYYKKPFEGVDISGMPLSPVVITTLLLLIAVFGPLAVNIYWWGTYIVGMSWQMIGTNLSTFMFNAVFFLFILPFTFLRLVYVYQIQKYYRGLTSKKRTITIGLLGEIQLTLIGLALIPFSIGNPFITTVISIPIPTLLFAGILVMYIIRVPQPIDGWKELDEGPDWLEERKQEEVKSQL